MPAGRHESESREPPADESPYDAEAAFTVPDFLGRGDEIGEVARVVIRAWERTQRAAGVGG